MTVVIKKKKKDEWNCLVRSFVWIILECNAQMETKPRPEKQSAESDSID